MSDQYTPEECFGPQQLEYCDNKNIDEDNNLNINRVNKNLIALYLENASLSDVQNIELIF